MKQMIKNFRMVLPLAIAYCDNTSAINISKNLVMHLMIKHIDIMHHFFQELVENGLVELKFVATQNQLVDLFAKTLDLTKFGSFRNLIGVFRAWGLNKLNEGIQTSINEVV